MKLPIPVSIDGKVYDAIKVKEATAGTVAATRAEAESGSIYSAVLEWCAGVTAEASGPDCSETDAQGIRRLVRAMPFESAYAVACHGMAETKGDDSLPGSYQCPKCGKVVTLGRFQEDGEEVDTSDHLYALRYETLEDPSDGVHLDLSKPVEIRRRDNDEVAERIESVTLNWPTLGQCIKAHQRYPDDESKVQFAVMAEALRDVNGKAVTPAWRATYGDLAFSRMSARDMKALNDLMKRYSLLTKVERVCMKCKTRWQPEVDLSGFFSSGLVG